MKKALALTALLLCAVACAKEQRVSFHVTPSYDPAAMRTYFVKRTDHSETSKVLQDVLERDLIAKGYAPAASDETADFEITYTIEQYRTGRENPAPKSTLELGDSGDGTYFGKQIYYANVWKVDLRFRDPTTKAMLLEGSVMTETTKPDLDSNIRWLMTPLLARIPPAGGTFDTTPPERAKKPTPKRRGRGNRYTR